MSGLAEMANEAEIVHSGPDTVARLPASNAPNRNNIVTPLCKKEPGKEGCILSSDERNEVINVLRLNVMDVLALYRTALLKVEMRKLAEKPEEMSFIGSLLLDVASAFLVGQLVKLGIKAHGLVKSAKTPFAGAPPSIDPAAAAVADEVTGAGPEGAIKSAVDKGAGKAKVGVTTGIQGATSDKAIDGKSEAVSYLNALGRAATVSFRSVAIDAPAVLTDEQLIRLRDRFDSTKFSEETFQALIQAKLDRYLKSGVTAIGRKYGEREIDEKFKLPFAEVSGVKQTQTVVRDTRVVWHVYESGAPKRLVFEKIDGRKQLHQIEKFEDSLEKGPPKFGPRHAITADPEFVDFVPDEFVDAAIARHEAKWGGPIPVMLIDDRAWLDPMRMGSASKSRK